MKVDNNTSVIYYRSILPKTKGDFVAALDDCIESLVDEASAADSVLFKLVIFHDPEDDAICTERKRHILSTLQLNLPGKCPAFTLIGQAPESPYPVSIEAAFIRKGLVKVSFAQSGEHPYVVFKYRGFKELWTSGHSGRDTQLPQDVVALHAFEGTQRILGSEEMNFNHVMRQWNYVGGILQSSSICDTLMQNYQIFNEIRHNVYGQYRTVKGFPAATGIGDKFRDITLEICAVQSDQEPVDFAILSPKQINPYEYSQQVLVGKPMNAQPIKHPPEFERAKLVITPYAVRVFISGTASISGQETIGIGDVEKQTRCTISNIESLVDYDNLKRNCPLIPPGRFEYNYLRVYVKYKDDMEKVKSICREKFPTLPITYIIADICRDDLLLEIEGEMILIP
jgi:hypothetical protein